MNNLKLEDQTKDINALEAWSQTFKLFGKPLQMTLSAVLNEISPPMFLLTATCENVTKHFWVPTRSDSRFIFVVDGSPLKGISAVINFSNWQNGDLTESAHLQITGYQLVIESVANETIVLREF